MIEAKSVSISVELISLKDIPRIYFLPHAIQATIVPIGDDSKAALFEFVKIINDL